MKIKKSPSNRLSPLANSLKSLIKKFNVPDSELSSLVIAWEYTKADLYHFIPLLNRLDSLLEEAVNASKTSNNTLVFNPYYQKLVLFILNFTRMLLEHSTNRSLYSSHDHLNSLLLSSDVTILESNLLLIHQLSFIRRSRSSSILSHHPEIITRITSLLQSFGSWTDSSISLPFYKSSEPKTYACSSSVVPDLQTIAGPYVILPINKISEANIAIPLPDLVSHCMNFYSIPESYFLSLFYRILIVRCIDTLKIRLLVLAICLLHIPESKSDIEGCVPILCQSVQSSDPDLQIAAFRALEAFTSYRNKFQEILTALNASANHGVLMFYLRNAIHSMNNGVILPYSESLISFLLAAIGTQSGSVFVSAGIVDVLSSAFTEQRPQSFPLLSKIVGVLDAVLYSYGNDFLSFVNSGNIDVFCERIKDTLTLCQNIIDVPVSYIVFLKSMMKFMLHTMQSANASDRVRNLPESSLVESVRDIIKARKGFGSAVYALSVNVLATFLHNEPTCYNVLQEKGLPETFMDSLCEEIPAHSDAMTCVPNALGALCLASNGIKLVCSQSIFDHFFKVFLSEAHMKNILDEDVGITLGSSFDELIRHHPVLKDPFFKSIYNVLDQIISLPPELEDVFGNKICYLTNDEPVKKVLGKAEVKDPLQIQYIEAICRFLEGFLTNPIHCKEVFGTASNQLFKIYSLILPYDFASSSASYSLSQVYRMMLEFGPIEILSSILENLDIQCLKEFLEYKDGSFFSNFVSLKEDNPKANEIFHSFVKIHNLVGLLCDVYSAPHFFKDSGSVVNVFFKYQNSIVDLLSLYRECAIESMIFRKTVPVEYITKKKEDEIGCDPNDSRIRNCKHFKYLVNNTTAYIVPIIQTLGKMLFAKSNSKGPLLAQIIGKELGHLLTCSRVPGPGSYVKYQYFDACASFLKSMIMDERTPPLLITGIAVELHSLGVISNLGEMFLILLDEIPLIDEEVKPKYDACIESVISFFNFICSAKPLLESSHSSHLKNFDSSKYLVDVRTQVLKYLVKGLEKRCLKSMISLFTLLMNEDGENSKDNEDLRRERDNLENTLMSIVKNNLSEENIFTVKELILEITGRIGIGVVLNQLDILDAISRRDVRMHLLALLSHEHKLKDDFFRIIETHIDTIIESLNLQDENYIASALLVIQAYVSYTENPLDVIKLKKISPEPLLKFIFQGKFTGNVLHSIFMLLIILTRSNENISPCLLDFLLRNYKEQPSLTTILFRHMLETKVTLKLLFQKEIIQQMSTPRERVCEISSFVKLVASVISRDPQVFLESLSVLKLQKSEPVNDKFYLLKGEFDSDKNLKDLLKHTNMSLIHTLMKEVMTEDHQKLCFFMQVLSEIFESFPGTRLSIMYANDPKGFIMFLLNQLAFPNLDNIQEKMKKNESLWTSHLISVLFSGDIDAPLRNMILECIAENIKESHGQYGRYLAFVDLINKLLLLKSTSAENLVKMMMEHNFLSLLTAIIAEVDLTYPDIKILMSSVLKALESLSKLANKVSRTGPRSKMLEYNLEQPRMDSSFIRDSALGIFGQPNDNSSESSEDSEIINEMEDMEMEEMDDEQDYSDMSEEEVSNAESEDSEDMDVSVRPAYPTLDEDETDIDEDEEHDDMDDDDIDNSPNSNGEDHSEGWSDVHEDNEEEYLDDEDGDNVMHIDVEVDDMDEMGEEDEDEEDISDQEHFSETYSVDGHVMATHDQRHRNRRHNDFFQNFRTNRANISFLERGQTAPVFLDDNGPFSWRGEGLPVESSTHPLLVNPQTSTRESDNPNNRVQIVNSLNTRNAFLGNDVNNAIEMLNSILNSGVRRGDWSNLQEGTAGRSQIIPFSNASGGGFAVMAGSNLNATTEDSNISKTEKSDFHLFRQVDRWAQESKIMHGNLTVEEMSKVNPKILGILIPLCKEEEEKKRIEEEEEKRAKEEKEKEEQERKKKEEEREKEEREKQEQQEKARAESEAMEIDAGTSAAPETSTQEVTRQMVMIEGHEVDLTDTGIDVSFLEALPEDMRGEVLRQHFREQNRDISSILPSSGVAADFLDALPDDIREEIMHQEEMDSAFNVFSRGAQRTFDGPSFLQNIFSGRRNHDDNTGLLSRRIQDEANGSKDLSLMKEPALIFDRNTILTICRLLFFPHTTIKLHFNQVMYNICENSKSRGDLLHLMIGIINECSTLSTADKKGKSSVRKSLCASVAPGFVLNGENSSPTVVSRCLELCLDLLSKNDHIGMFFLVNENVDNGDALPNSSAKKKRKKGIPLISLLELLEKELFLKNPALMDMLTQLIALAVRPVGAKEKLIGEDETY